jgi:hypothetical protein
MCVDPGTNLFDYLKSAAKVNAWWCTLKQSCSKFVMEQKLFYGHLMKMAGTCSNRAYKPGFHAISAHRKIS